MSAHGLRVPFETFEDVGVYVGAFEARPEAALVAAEDAHVPARRRDARRVSSAP
ncbi:MAG: hypothetical protein ACK6CU_01060 [Deltaproteobacteria bacterium]